MTTGDEVLEALQRVTIYTDGACIGNPGPGGYGVVMMCGEHRKELSGGFKLTTNNRMEIYGVIVGLSTLKRRCQVTVYSDSQYVVNAIEKRWAEKWRLRNWMRTKEDKAVNPDLWAELLDLIAKHDVQMKWVRGHSGNKENERCDELAVAASHQPNLPEDVGYRKRNVKAAW